MGAWQNAKCQLAFHQDDWRYVSEADEERCQQVSRCLNCGAVRTREQHVFRQWLPIDNAPCYFERACDRCGEVETKREHDFPEFRRAAGNIAVQERKCRRCIVKERKGRGRCPTCGKSMTMTTRFDSFS